ncbi:MAG: DUF1786 family protein [Chloroflexia bacterium]
MRILCIDVGTGTQDILLFDSSTEIENCVHMIMPSPTQILARRVREATARQHTLLLDGVTMGGGPGAWAVEDHIKAGLEVYAVPDAARTFDDDLARVEAMGVRVVSPGDLDRLRHDLGPARATLLAMEDVTLGAIHTALSMFEEPACYDALAVAVFDHGNAPPGYSDRRFRFDYISQQLRKWVDEPVETALAAFAAPAGEVHPDLTRMLAVASTLAASDYADLPLLLMDTGPAALLGALGDPVVRKAADGSALFVNVGNFHVLAFHIVGGRIRALFEHHTGLVDRPKLVRLLQSMSAGTLTNQQVFDDSGHGALTMPGAPGVLAKPTVCLVTGPRRFMLAGMETPWPVYLAVPHGDMMLAGCYGLLRAFAVHFPHSAEAITLRLDGPP